MPRTPSLDTLRASLQRLTLTQKQTLHRWLGDLIAEELHAATQPEQLEIPQRGDRAVTETRHYEGKTYQHEKRRCNRAGCKCMGGDVTQVGHGPYWYAYWKEQGKLRNQYIGKRVPWHTEQNT